MQTVLSLSVLIGRSLAGSVGAVGQTLALCGFLIACASVVHAAPGTNLAWSACSGSDTRTSTCWTNTGVGGDMIVSLRAPAGQNLWTGFGCYLEIQSDGATLPQWWYYKTAGNCRSSAFTAAAAGFGPLCTDPYLGGGFGGVSAYNVGFGGANRARTLIGFAIAAGTEQPLTPDEVYGVANAKFSNTKTVGTGSCAG